MCFEFCNTITSVAIKLSTCATNDHGLIPAHHIRLDDVFLNFRAFRCWSPVLGLHRNFMVRLLELVLV